MLKTIRPPAKKRGKDAAALDAAGAGLGSVALAVFGAVMWFLASDTAPILALATMARRPVGNDSERETRNQISLSAVRMPDLR